MLILNSLYQFPRFLNLLVLFLLYLNWLLSFQFRLNHLFFLLSRLLLLFLHKCRFFIFSFLSHFWFLNWTNWLYFCEKVNNFIKVFLNDRQKLFVVPVFEYKVSLINNEEYGPSWIVNNKHHVEAYHGDNDEDVVVAKSVLLIFIIQEVRVQVEIHLASNDKNLIDSFNPVLLHTHQRIVISLIYQLSQISIADDKYLYTRILVNNSECYSKDYPSHDKNEEICNIPFASESDATKQNTEFTCK